MPWETSTRTSTLPKDWRRRRQLVLARDGYQCTRTTNGQRCTQRATDVHHAGDPNNHDPTNLVSLCDTHHQDETKKQSAAARWRYRNQREPETHPGLNR